MTRPWLWQHLGLPEELSQLGAFLHFCSLGGQEGAEGALSWKGAHSPLWGDKPSAPVLWLWHKGLSVGMAQVTLCLPPPWAGLQGLHAQHCGVGGTSGNHGDPLSAHTSFLLQDYMDALITNYCVSAGRSLSLSCPLHGAAMGSVGTP